MNSTFSDKHNIVDYLFILPFIVIIGIAISIEFIISLFKTTTKKESILSYKHGDIVDSSGDFDYVVHLNERDNRLNAICTLHKPTNGFFSCEYTNIDNKEEIKKAIVKLKKNYS